MTLLFWSAVATLVSVAHAQIPPLPCAGKCSLALCLDSSDSISPKDYEIMAEIVQRIIDITLAADKWYRIGFAIYAGEVADARTCFMSDDEYDLRNCTQNAFRPKIRDRESTHLELCFNLLNSHEKFWKTAYATCEYRVIVLTDGNTSNMRMSAFTARQLRAKGVEIWCYTLGHPDDYDHRQEYDRICNKHFQIDTVQNFHDDIENIVNVPSCGGGDVTPSHTPTTTPPRPPHPCDDCRIVSGVGYKRDPNNCACWIQCIFGPNKSVKVIRQCCPCSTFWNNDDIACVLAADVSCEKDPCGGGALNAPHTDNCRSYWTCSGGTSISTQCCLPTFKYDKRRERCMPDPRGLCKDDCVCKKETTSIPNIPTCGFTWDPTDPYSYFVQEHEGMQPTKMRCPAGTFFNKTRCLCVNLHQKVIRPPVCDMILDIRCTEDPLVDHAEDTYISNENVVVHAQDGQCSFDGSSRLLVSRFSNWYWGRVVGVYCQFFGKPNATNHNVSLISNDDCNNEASIEIRLMRFAANAPIVEAIVRTYTKVVSLIQPYREFESNEVYLSYKNDLVIFSIRYSDGSVLRVDTPATGNIRSTTCALQVGYGWEDRYYCGRMYNVHVWRECLPDDFHPTV